MVNLLRQGREEDLWQMCCGFLDLPLERVMAIQRRLLMEQISLLGHCRLGAKLLHGHIPDSVEAFRKLVPLTNYTDYMPDLPEKRVQSLPARPLFWQHSSGRTGEYGAKWVPLTAAFCDHLARTLLGLAILSGCRERNVVSRLSEKPRMVYAVAPQPYTSGTLVRILDRAFPIRCLPNLEVAEALSFEDRVREGLQLALAEGIDGFGGLSLALVAVGERMAMRKNGQKPALPSDLRALLRLATGTVRSRLAGRPLLPRDLWRVKGITSGGTDSLVLRDRIRELWGRYALDTYTCTEGGVVATQAWDYGGMTFIPDLNFLEFLPEAEIETMKDNPNHQPGTLLLDEVRSGESYEIVLTNFHGGALVRYRMGDIIRIISLENSVLGFKQPQIAFDRRADDLIDLGGYIRVTERTLWLAINTSGVAYVDWVAKKETGSHPLLHIYLELADGTRAHEATLARKLYQELAKLDDRVNATQLYEGFEKMLDTLPVRVHFLPAGAFAHYTECQRKRGADLAHLKPPHINPADETMTALVQRDVPAGEHAS
jgi:hypothetical protein